MSAIKKFFEKRKLSLKFKKAGEGHRLNDSPSHVYHNPAVTHPSPVGGGDEEAGAAKLDAAVARMEAKQQIRQADSMVAQRAEMKREMETVKKRQNEEEVEGAAARSGSVEEVEDGGPVVETVRFRCPEIGSQVLTKSEMESAIHKFLLDHYEDEPEMMSALMIHTLNKDEEKVRVCVETLVKYLDNIISKPMEEKYWKIRLCNKAFQERVVSMRGTEEFLLAAGFSLRFFPFEDDEARFYVLDPELAKDIERLHYIKEVLIHAEPIRPILDRDLKVFYPSDSVTSFDVPEDFYISVSEIKREQQRRKEATEKLEMLCTKEMREKDEQREVRKYRYTLLRIRFPDGILLQGVFRATETVNHVYKFVKENLLNNSIPFQLFTEIGNKLDKGDTSLAELGLAPAAVLSFVWDTDTQQEMASHAAGETTHEYLKPRVMALARKL